jgi:hypothetical protein
MRNYHKIKSGPDCPFLFYQEKKSLILLYNNKMNRVSFKCITTLFFIMENLKGDFNGKILA